MSEKDLLFSWETPSFVSDGLGIDHNSTWPEGVKFNGSRFYTQSTKWEYHVTISIKRSAKEMKITNYHYQVEGHFIFTGTTAALSIPVRNDVPFSAIITESKCEWYQVTLCVPQGMNNHWPECIDARIRIETKLAYGSNGFDFDDKTTEKPLQTLKNLKNTHDLWICAGDGITLGLHHCFATLYWSNFQEKKFQTNPQSPFGLKVGSVKTLSYVLGLMYGGQIKAKYNLYFWEEVFDICLFLGFVTHLDEIEAQMFEYLKHDLTLLMKFATKYPKIKSFHEQKVHLIRENMKGFIEFMDQKDAEK